MAQSSPRIVSYRTRSWVPTCLSAQVLWVGEAQSKGGAGVFVGDNANLRAGSIVLMGAVIAKDSDIFTGPVVRASEERR